MSSINCILTPWEPWYKVCTTRFAIKEKTVFLIWKGSICKTITVLSCSIRRFMYIFSFCYSTVTSLCPSRLLISCFSRPLLLSIALSSAIELSFSLTIFVAYSIASELNLPFVLHARGFTPFETIFHELKFHLNNDHNIHWDCIKFSLTF